MEDKDIPTEDATQSLRNELLLLAEKHEIKHSVAYIKKASHDALEKIKEEYKRKQLEETNEYLSDTLIGKFSQFMEGLEMIENAKNMEEELVCNKMIKRDIKTMLGYLTPFVPLIGLICGVTIVGKHVINKRRSQAMQTEDKEEEYILL